MRNSTIKSIGLLLLTLSVVFIVGCKQVNSQQIIVKSVAELEAAVQSIKPDGTIFISDGIFQDVKLIVKNSGEEGNPIVIRAQNRGKVYFSGDVNVELRGEYIVLDGIYFKNGNRKPNEWKSHGPGLVAMYGSHNRVTQCAFHAFDQANSAYITTSLNEDGTAPQYCRIDHCSFTEKITFDQVINLNNKAKKEVKSGNSGIPMYHRIDHCYFSNPKKPGNAGGGIRVGYWRSDFGRCLIDNNLFERQDSEPEIVTSKSMENVYYNNTCLNCAGTLNFRHGDKQVAINNFFIGNDSMYEYGGMFVWGSEHIIANNYFSLPTTLRSRGNAALYLNVGAVGAEHALAFDLQILNNVFERNNGYAINFSALYKRRVSWCAENGLKLELPRDMTIANNLFISDQSNKYPFFYKHDASYMNINWKNNMALNGEPGFEISDGITLEQKDDAMNVMEEYANLLRIAPKGSNPKLYNIQGINLDIPGLVAAGMKGKPLTRRDVGPDWLEKIPGTYAHTGKLTPELQKKFDEVTKQRK